MGENQTGYSEIMTLTLADPKSCNLKKYLACVHFSCYNT
jgi:hypothetical protein